MPPEELFQSIAGFLKSRLYGDTKLWVLALAGYCAITLLMWLPSARQGGTASVRSLWRYAFPSEFYRHPTARISHWHYLLNLLMWVPLIGYAVFWIFGVISVQAPVEALLAEHFGPRSPVIRAEWLIVAVQFTVILLSGTFSDYIIHYAFHKNAFLWSFHRGHHSLEAMTLPAYAREHPALFLVQNPVAAVFSGITMGTVAYALGTPLRHYAIGVLFGYFGLKHAIAIFNHSHVPVSFGWLNRVFQGPVMHQVHHSMALEHRDKNIGDTLMIWDWMFGTLYLPKKGETFRFGLNETEYGVNNPHLTLRAFYLEPFSYAWAVLRRWRKPQQHRPGHDSTQPARPDGTARMEP